MTGADERLRRLLTQRDAPDRDDTFVSAVMARAAPRTASMPALLRPLWQVAPLIALAAVAPLLVKGLEAILMASDPQVLGVSLGLALSGWLVFGAFWRTFRPALAT